MIPLVEYKAKGTAKTDSRKTVLSKIKWSDWQKYNVRCFKPEGRIWRSRNI